MISESLLNCIKQNKTNHALLEQKVVKNTDYFADGVTLEH